MRHMRVANRGFFALASTAFTAAIFAACASSSTPPAPASGGDTTTAPAPSATSEAAALPGDTTSAPTPPRKTPLPSHVDDCKKMPPEELRADLTNEPDGGVCMNNAMTSADAGSSDRCAGMTDAVRASRNAFRCCYDLYARNNPNEGAHVVLHVELAPDGAIQATSLNKERSNLTAPEFESCMVAIAGGLSFPKSPSGKETRFNYPFDFKPRR
jgi:hypothetical protein